VRQQTIRDAVVRIAYDAGKQRQRALGLVARFASVTQSTVHRDSRDGRSDHRYDGHRRGRSHAVTAGSMFVHGTLEPGTPGAAVAAVIERTQCDALFAGARMSAPDAAVK